MRCLSAELVVRLQGSTGLGVDLTPQSRIPIKFEIYRSRSLMKIHLVVVAAILLLPCASSAQTIEGSVGYSFTPYATTPDSSFIDDVTRQGWYGEAHLILSDLISIEGQISGSYSKIEKDRTVYIHDWLFGLRFVARKIKGVEPYGHLLLGPTYRNWVATSTGWSVSTGIGGGAIVPVKGNFGVDIGVDFKNRLEVGHARNWHDLSVRFGLNFR
jgi:hypothetical protein